MAGHSVETFKRSWLRGWTRSSEGYSIRILGQTGIHYEDTSGVLRIDSEVMASPHNEVVVYSGSIPDLPERTRADVLDRLRRGLGHDGWVVTVEDAWIE